LGVTCVLPDDYVKIEGSGGGGATADGGDGGEAGHEGGAGAVGGVGGTGGVGGSGGAGGAGGSGGTGCAIIPSGDTFDGTTLDSQWTVNPPALTGVSYDVNGGELVVTLDNTVPGMFAWYDEDRGWLAHQTACGDFAAAVTVTVTDAAGTGVPANDFNSGGLLVRHPGQPQNDEFWAMVSIGVQDSSTQRAETKATQHSSSLVVGHDLIGGPTLSGRVAMCRVGTQIRLSARAPGRAWETLVTYDENGSGAPDGEVSLPALVEVGIVTNGWAEQDVQARFENAAFWLPAGLNDCTD
jgi:hypothetical protein